MKSIVKDGVPASISPEAIREFAREGGLRYVSDAQPGFTRKRKGKGFSYLDDKNCRIGDEEIIARIRKLAIPPAWEGVWICKHETGHLQATGRDVRERKQYRYHPTWTILRNENKFGKLRAFGESLPMIRARVDADLSLRGYPKAKVLAAVVRTMELTRIRVGNDVYAEANESFGLTTIRNEHARVRGERVNLDFKGKSGVLHEVDFRDARISRIIAKCQELPGEELFTYQDEDGVAHDVDSGDVNEYLREISGQAITAKDFRTWGGTAKAIEVLAAAGRFKESTKKAAKAREMAVFRSTAEHLRNTVAVCRKFYVHPLIFAADKAGDLHELHARYARRRAKPFGLSTEELVMMTLLEQGK